jgi:hypothetical protein
MKVRMLTQECGPSGNYAPGDERTVSDDLGCVMVANGYAADVTPKPVETAAVAPPEAAAVIRPEAAVVAPVETRKQGKRK